MATAVALAGFGTYYVFVRDPGAARKAEAKAREAAAAVQAKAAPKKALTGGDQGFVALQLDQVEAVNHNTKRFRFKLPEEDMVSGLHVTSAVLTRFQAEGQEKPTVRPYTPVNDEGEFAPRKPSLCIPWPNRGVMGGEDGTVPDAADCMTPTDQQGYLDLLVKRYDNGPMSTHIHSLVPGQKLEIKGPLPKYPWTANKHAHIALVAGGTGITPMWQLARAIFANPEDKTKVTLVFGNIAEEDILLREQLAELENTYPQRFRAFYLLDKPPAAWAGSKGFVTKELLKTVLPEPKEDNVKVFVCGPTPMMKAVSGTKKSPADQGELGGILKDLGYDKEQVYKF